MERINRIWVHPIYQKHYKELQKLECGRIFCNHSINHFLDVARIAWIYNLEEQTGLNKEIVYAAALLHDIGRYEQIITGISHDEAGAKIAEIILSNCGFNTDETEIILEAILKHRSEPHKSSLLYCYIYRADKQSRNCFACSAYDACNWDLGKKNLHILI